MTTGLFNQRFQAPPPQPNRHRRPGRQPEKRRTLESKAIEKLAAGVPLKVICDELGVHRQTIANWRDTNPEFDRQVEERLREYEEAGRAAARRGMQRAVERVNSLLDSRDENVQLKAANTLLALWTKLNEGREQAEQLAAVEERIAALQGRLLGAASIAEDQVVDVLPMDDG